MRHQVIQIIQVKCIYNIAEYKKEQRNNKIKRLINGTT